MWLWGFQKPAWRVPGAGGGWRRRLFGLGRGRGSRWVAWGWVVAVAWVAGWCPVARGGGEVEDYVRRARAHGSILGLPAFESSPEEIRASAERAVRRGDVALRRLGRLKAARWSFADTVGELDRLLWEFDTTVHRFELLKEVSAEVDTRRVAREAAKRLKEWKVAADYREDVYGVIRDYAGMRPALEGEEARLLAETLRDYRRAGLELARDQRAVVEARRKELARLCADFDAHVDEATAGIAFTREELAGVPEALLVDPQVARPDGTFLIQAQVTWQFVTVMEHARMESTRRRLKAARCQLAAHLNVPLLGRILALRAEVARRLGYASWADYRIESKMAGTAAAAREFVERLIADLQPKFTTELEAMRELKVRETGDPAARIEHWDWRYYGHRLVRERHGLDPDSLRGLFPYDMTLAGLFGVCERLLGVRIELVEAPAGVWAEGVELRVVSDAVSGEPLGALYLDMFPREGKFPHFAQFALIAGRKEASGRYRLPVAALVCNFPEPVSDAGAHLTLDQVQTLCHEMGHAVHTLLGRTRYARFAGTGVPRDFVEVPSQLFEHWARDPAVLGTFVMDPENAGRGVSRGLMERVEQARLALLATFHRRQLSLAMADLVLHGPPEARAGRTAVEVGNEWMARVFLPAPEDTAWVASFNHLTGGYDAGYYGYAWAEAIAADLATSFRQAPGGLLDAAVGRRLRSEVLAPGSSREVKESLRQFLGRDWSSEAFLQSLGIIGDRH